MTRKDEDPAAPQGPAASAAPLETPQDPDKSLRLAQIDRPAQSSDALAAALRDAQAQVLKKPRPAAPAPRAAAPASAPAAAPAAAPMPAAGGTGGGAAAGALTLAGAGGGGAGGAAKSGKDPYSSRGPMWLGALALVVLVGGFGAWAATSDLSSAVVAAGKIEVETKQQVVEHPDGGVVGEILVRDGDRVDAGQLLLRLDDTLMRNEQASLSSQYWEFVARAARLRAEQREEDEVVFPDDLLEVAKTFPEVADIVDGQATLFAARRRSYDDQVDQLRERQRQISQQVTGAEAQIDANERQLALIAQELEGQQKLYDQGLAQLNRLLALQREEASLQGEVGRLTASIAEAKGRASEIEIQILNLLSQRQEQSITELRDIQYQQNQVREQLASVAERLDRLDVRAPIGGVVTGNTVFALRSVVTPGEPILYIVPQDVELVIEAQIDDIFIDQVWAGQPATLRFSAFSSRQTPELNGHVVKVSPDAFQDERTGRTYYTATLAPDEGELEKLQGLTLVPGMPVEGYIKAGERTPLSYLTKPLTDYFSRAMIEE